MNTTRSRQKNNQHKEAWIHVYKWQHTQQQHTCLWYFIPVRVHILYRTCYAYMHAYNNAAAASKSGNQHARRTPIRPGAMGVVLDCMHFMCVLSLYVRYV